MGKMVKTLPTEGQFVAIWEHTNKVWSDTFRYVEGILECYQYEAFDEWSIIGKEPPWNNFACTMVGFIVPGSAAEEEEPDPNELIEHELDELWREYEWADKHGNYVSHRIEKPLRLYIRRGGSTHRILDADGTAHCVPAPEVYGCVLKWESKNGVYF